MGSQRLQRLRDRAHMLGLSRAFFAARGVCEVDCPALCAGTSVDVHIDLIPAYYSENERRHLHSSPEFGMKRLIAEGMGDIYQLSHVFRDSEWSSKHNPEFTMAEWYRVGASFTAIIEETLDYIRLFLGPLPSLEITYREAIQQYTGIDYVVAAPEMLYQFLQDQGVDSHLSVDSPRDDLLNVILGLFVEPKLGLGQLCVLKHYPATQAALAQTLWRNDEQVAERFEVYFQGVELANGYHELTNAAEQRQRFVEANIARTSLGKGELPLDEHFLNALEGGFPDCCGVAVGFDRLMMLRHRTDQIADILPFGWALA